MLACHNIYADIISNKMVTVECGAMIPGIEL
jgi:hypothetical protein